MWQGVDPDDARHAHVVAQSVESRTVGYRLIEVDGAATVVAEDDVYLAVRADCRLGALVRLPSLMRSGLPKLAPPSALEVTWMLTRLDSKAVKLT